MNSVKKKVVAGAVTVLAATVMAIGGAEVASATAYCDAHLYDNTQSVPQGPTTALQCQMQAGPARGWGDQVYSYTGPVDGVLGTNSWKGVQAQLKAYWGYTGPVDGHPGPNTYNAMIRAGNSWGWGGVKPQDGSLSSADWQGYAYYLRVVFFGD